MSCSLLPCGDLPWTRKSQRREEAAADDLFTNQLYPNPVLNSCHAIQRDMCGKLVLPHETFVKWGNTHTCRVALSNLHNLRRQNSEPPAWITSNFRAWTRMWTGHKTRWTGQSRQDSMTRHPRDNIPTTPLYTNFAHKSIQISVDMSCWLKSVSEFYRWHPCHLVTLSHTVSPYSSVRSDSQTRQLWHPQLLSLVSSIHAQWVYLNKTFRCDGPCS